MMTLKQIKICQRLGLDCDWILQNYSLLDNLLKGKEEKIEDLITVHNLKGEKLYKAIRSILSSSYKLPENSILLHVLFSHMFSKEDAIYATKIAPLFIEKGVNINTLSPKNNSHFIQEIINSKLTDQELQPVYEFLKKQRYNLKFDTPNIAGYTPIDLAKKVPYRKQLYKILSNINNSKLAISILDRAIKESAGTIYCIDGDDSRIEIYDIGYNEKLNISAIKPLIKRIFNRLDDDIRKVTKFNQALSSYSIEIDFCPNDNPYIDISATVYDFEEPEEISLTLTYDLQGKLIGKQIE